MQKYENGWLDRQLRLAKREVENWPEELREEMDKSVERFYASRKRPTRRTNPEYQPFGQEED